MKAGHETGNGAPFLIPTSHFKDRLSGMSSVFKTWSYPIKVVIPADLFGLAVYFVPVRIIDLMVVPLMDG